MDTPTAEQPADTSSADGAPAPVSAGATADKILEAAASSGAEAKPQPERPAEPPKQKIAPEVAAIAKRERAITTREREVREQAAAAEALAAKYKPLAEAIEKRDVRTLIKLTGAPLPDVIEALSQLDEEPAPAEPTPAEIARAEAQKLFDEQKAAEKAAAEKEFNERYERTVTAKTAEIQRLAASDTDRWERLSVDDTVEWEQDGKRELVPFQTAAWRLIEQWHAETGQVLKLEEALDEIEALQLARHERIAKGKKLGASASKDKKPTEAASATKEPARAATPTISNRDGGRTVVDDSDEDESNHIAGLPDSARIERAMRKAGIAA